MEHGGGKDKTFTEDKGRVGLGPIIKMLTEKTGRTKFTINEILNPDETIRKFKESKESKV
jgi:hypothetical protein